MYATPPVSDVAEIEATPLKSCRTNQKPMTISADWKHRSFSSHAMR
jgi:hypothetical protein